MRWTPTCGRGCRRRGPRESRGEGEERVVKEVRCLLIWCALAPGASTQSVLQGLAGSVRRCSFLLSGIFVVGQACMGEQHVARKRCGGVGPVGQYQAHVLSTELMSLCWRATPVCSPISHQVPSSSATALSLSHTICLCLCLCLSLSLSLSLHTFARVHSAAGPDIRSASGARGPAGSTCNTALSASAIVLRIAFRLRPGLLYAQGNGKRSHGIFFQNYASLALDRRDTGGRRYGAVGSRVGLIIQRSSVRSRLAAINFAGSICCHLTVEPGTLPRDSFLLMPFPAFVSRFPRLRAAGDTSTPNHPCFCAHRINKPCLRYPE